MYGTDDKTFVKKESMQRQRYADWGHKAFGAYDARGEEAERGGWRNKRGGAHFNICARFANRWLLPTCWEIRDSRRPCTWNRNIWYLHVCIMHILLSRMGFPLNMVLRGTSYGVSENTMFFKNDFFELFFQYSCQIIPKFVIRPATIWFKSQIFVHPSFLFWAVVPIANMPLPRSNSQHLREADKKENIDLFVPIFMH